MSTNMTGGADGGIAIQVRLDTSKASKELNRLEQKILKLQEEVTVGKAKKSALVAQLEQANAELTALQAKTKIDGKSFVISPEDSKRISDLKIQIEQTQTAIEQQNKALSDAQLTLEGVKTRYGEVTHTLDNIRIGIENSKNAVLCVNADDSLCASLHDVLPNPVVFFGVDTPIYHDRVEELSDAPYCIRCKHEYVYDYVTYGHLGGYRCPNCGYHRPQPQVHVTKVLRTDDEHSEVIFEENGKQVPASIHLPGGYNIYNACACMAAASVMGIDMELAAKSLSSFACGFGRMEKFRINDADVRMILIKNPAGCNQVLNFLTQRTEPFVFAACLNDRAQDGKDISWIWDVDFERLTAMEGVLSDIYVSGVRADDMALRFLYAGFPKERIHVQKDYAQLMQEATGKKLPVFVMPTYTAMLALRGTIAKRYGYKEFWQ